MVRKLQQKGQFDCGVTCVRMLAGCEQDEAERAFADYDSVAEEGSDPTSVRAALKKLNFSMGNENKISGCAESKELALWRTKQNCLVGYKDHWLVWDAEEGRLICPDDEELNWRRVCHYFTVKEIS